MLRYLTQGGEVGGCLLAQDWRGSPLGDIAHWPAQLHDTLRITLHSEFPHIVYWGEDLHTFWNDAARHFFEGQHPHDLGRPLADVQPDVMHTLHPLLRQVFETGRAVLQSDIELLYRRADYTEEIHEVFSYSPLFDAEGQVRGIIAPIFDATARVLGARRMAMLADMTSATRGSHTLAQYCEALQGCMERHPRDLPRTALYLPETLDGHATRWHKHVASGTQDEGWPASFSADSVDPTFVQLLRGTPQLRVLSELGDGVQMAAVPIPEPNAARPSGWLLVALNPLKRLDADYRNFLSLVAMQISQGLADTLAIERAAERALEEIGKRARLSTLGELATSIAHEINQPLTAMVLDANACVRWLTMQPANLEEASAAARRIADSGEFAGQVIARIRGFLRRDPSPHTLLRPEQVAWDSLRLVAAQARRFDIELRVRIAPNLPQVMGDRTQLQQVLINLMVNAVDALQSLPAGAHRTIQLQLTGGADGVRLAVADTGPGFTAAQLPRLFDAFQSSKPQGLGFGLSIARSIVEAHKGRIQAGTSESGGALVWFELPSEPAS